MKKQELFRKYGMSDSELKQLADQMANRVQRDLTDFANRNITQAVIDDFRAKVKTWDDLPSDIELEGLKSTATLEKQTKGDELKALLVNFRNMATLAFGSGPKYRPFAFDGMNAMKDHELRSLGKRTLRLLGNFQAELAQQGLIQDDITKLDDAVEAFDLAIDKQEAKIEERDLATQERIEKGNEIWDEMGRLASIGKTIFARKDEAKYNDYVINDAKKPDNQSDQADPAKE